MAVLGSVKWAELGELVWAAPLAALAVTVAYGVLVLGVSRATESGRGGAPGAALVYGAVALAGGLLFLGGVAAGIWIIAS